MYQELANKLVVGASSDLYSPAVDMGDHNSAELDVVTFVYGGSALTVAFQGSNDAENWSADLSAITISGVGWQNTSLTYTAWRFLRAHANNKAASGSVVSLGFYPSTL